MVNDVGLSKPGFIGWHKQPWLYHSGEGAVFVGLAGCRDLVYNVDCLVMPCTGNRGLAP